MTSTPTNFFPKEAAQVYDQKNAKLSKIADALHFLMGLALRDLPANAKILCVGVGTGAEIVSLAQMYPGWSFVGIDPSQDMLDVAGKRMQELGLASRCEFQQGYAQDLKSHSNFDAALCILVAHFVKREERLSLFRNMTSRLRVGGYLVNAEISFDLNSPEFPGLLKGWEGVQSLMGATPESLANLPKLMREVLTIVPPQEAADYIRQAGIKTPIPFYQAMMIHAWFGKKEN